MFPSLPQYAGERGRSFGGLSLPDAAATFQLRLL